MKQPRVYRSKHPNFKLPRNQVIPDKREIAYNKAYAEAVAEGINSMSDLDIAINEKMDEAGFIRGDI